jgi:Arc/MetJ-type ribon-helix-helix transcriptional regulator
MPSESDTVQIPLPSTLVAEVRTIADEEHRPAADVLRDLVAAALAERRWKAEEEQELARAREFGLPDDTVPLTDEYRRVIREKIAEGFASARSGRLADGETIFDRIFADLDEDGRQGQK